MASIQDARLLSQLDHALATVATIRPDGSPQLTVVNAGIITHPVDDVDVAAFVAHGGTRKLDHLRARPTATLLWRAGWSWVALEGNVELCGPDNPRPGLTAADLQMLYRHIAEAGGMHHEDWDEYDRLVRADRRTAVLITPRRIYRNP